MARLPAASELAGIEGIFTPGTTYYLAIFSSDPTTSGSAGEITGYSGNRPAIVFTATGGGGNTIISNGAQNFTSMPAVTGTNPIYIGIFSAATGGTYLGGGVTNLSAPISSGASVSFGTGEIVAAVS